MPVWLFPGRGAGGVRARWPQHQAQEGGPLGTRGISSKRLARLGPRAKSRVWSGSGLRGRAEPSAWEWDGLRARAGSNETCGGTVWGGESSVLPAALPSAPWLRISLLQGARAETKQNKKITELGAGSPS